MQISHLQFLGKAQFILFWSPFVQIGNGTGAEDEAHMIYDTMNNVASKVHEVLTAATKEAITIVNKRPHQACNQITHNRHLQAGHMITPIGRTAHQGRIRLIMARRVH